MYRIPKNPNLAEAQSRFCGPSNRVHLTLLSLPWSSVLDAWSIWSIFGLFLVYFWPILVYFSSHCQLQLFKPLPTTAETAGGPQPQQAHTAPRQFCSPRGARGPGLRSWAQLPSRTARRSGIPAASGPPPRQMHPEPPRRSTWRRRSGGQGGAEEKQAGPVGPGGPGRAAAGLAAAHSDWVRRARRRVAAPR